MSLVRGWKAEKSALHWCAQERAPLVPGWARIRLLLGGICGTDHQLLQGYAGFEGFLGHEFVGLVTECDEAGWVGRRVVGEINVGCGDCALCASQGARFCPQRRVLGIRGLDGVFAESFSLPLRNLHRVDDLDPELAVWTEPLAAALEVTRHLKPQSEILVLGDGKLGSLLALALTAEGHSLTLVGKHPEKVQRLQAIGLQALLSPRGEWPVVIEATGSPRGIESALQWVRPQGLVVMKSTVAQPAATDLNAVVVQALTIVGSRCGLFGPALEALRSGKVDPRPLVDQVVPLSKLPEAMTLKGGFKVLVRGLA